MSEPSEHRDVEDGSGKEKRRGGKISEALEELTKNCQEKLNRDMMIFRTILVVFARRSLCNSTWLRSVDSLRMCHVDRGRCRHVSYKSPTCLMIALDEDMLTYKVLIDNGADINAPDWAGYPIYFAVQSSESSVKLLIQAGIDVNLSIRSTR